MHVSHYMHDILTFFHEKNSIWMQKTYFNFYKILHAGCKISRAYFQKLKKYYG